VIKSENYFYACNGVILKDKYELFEFLKTIDEATFSAHVNVEKNDFANWIRDVLKDENLAKKMFQSTKKDKMLDFIEESLKKKNNEKKDRKSVINKLVKVIKDG
jgi:hypothetical protein